MNNEENIQGGAKANKNGKIFEETLKPIFQERGYLIIKQSDKNINEVCENNDKVVILNARYKTIYQHNGKTEFLIINKKTNLKIRVECKWQQTSGSVDEKFPYLYLNCIYGFEEKDIILIIDGEGQKKGAIEWLKDKVNTKWLNDDKNIKVMRLTEFLKWFNLLNH